MTAYEVQVEIQEKDIDHYLPASPVHGTRYRAELLITEDPRTADVQLKIYYERHTQLERKLDLYWRNSRKELCQVLHLLPCKNSGLKAIDISTAETRNLSYDDKADADGVIILHLHYVRLVMDAPAHPQAGADFLLPPSAEGLITPHYTFYSFADGYTWQAYHRYGEYMRFGNMYYLLDFRFQANGRKDGILIQRQPRLCLRTADIQEQEMIKHADAICILLSLYTQHNMDYRLASLPLEDGLVRIIYTAATEIHTPAEGIFCRDFSNNVLALVERTHAQTLLEHLHFFRNVVRKLNLGMAADGETRFILFYNIVEQIRNFFVAQTDATQEPAKQVEEQFTFTRSRTQTDKFIKAKIKEIAEIVRPEQQEEFLHIANQKVEPIKYKPMRNQFQSFFAHLNLDLQTYGLDFGVLKELRDTIFHGHEIDYKSPELRTANEKLPRLAGVLILRALGIADVKLEG